MLQEGQARQGRSGWGGHNGHYDLMAMIMNKVALPASYKVAEGGAGILASSLASHGLNNAMRIQSVTCSWQPSWLTRIKKDTNSHASCYWPVGQSASLPLSPLYLPVHFPAQSLQSLSLPVQELSLKQLFISSIPVGRRREKLSHSSNNEPEERRVERERESGARLQFCTCCYELDRPA